MSTLFMTRVTKKTNSFMALFPLPVAFLDDPGGRAKKRCSAVSPDIDSRLAATTTPREAPTPPSQNDFFGIFEGEGGRAGNAFSSGP